MKKKLNKIICILLLFLSFILALNYGASNFGVYDFFRILRVKIFGGDLSSNYNLIHNILFYIRLPRLLVAALCGASLSAAGVLSQGLFRNPLASPTLIGTTSGASFFAALTFYFGSAYLSWYAVPIAAFCGAIVATFFIIYIASLRRVSSIENLLLCGLAINTLLGALTSFVISLSLEQYQKIPALMYWLMGGLSAKTWQHFFIGVFPVIIACIFSYLTCGQLNVLVFGEEVASSLSLNITRLKYKVIILISILVGISVSIAGAITFIGLIIPHITRLLIGPEHKSLFIFSIINGITLILLADLLARTIRFPQEIQVGIIIALIGAPFFFWLLLFNVNGKNI